MSSYLVPVILLLSILLQVASAVTAILLARVSRCYKPWMLIAVAIVLMAVSRVVSLGYTLSSGAFTLSSPLPELVALVISVLMLVGLILFRPVFVQVRKLQQESARAIEQNQLLVRESRHHIKNDLNMLLSLITMEQATLPPGEARDLCTELELRIRSFALLHEELYDSAGYGAQFSHYIEQLVSSIRDVYGRTGPEIDINLDLADVGAERKEMLYAGLVLNEALTNIYKHAFPPGTVTRPRVTVSLAQDGPARVLEVTDNGVGLAHTTPTDEESSSSYGMTFIRAIGESEGWDVSVTSPVHALPAESEYPRPDGPGTSLRLRF